MKRNATQWIAVGFLALVLGGCSKEAPAGPAQAPPKVTVAHPEARELVDYAEYNGWTSAAETVEVRSRVRGHIDKVHFEDGQVVATGDPLYTLDPRPFEAELARAKEQLNMYEAQKVAADREFARLKELLGKGGASQSQVDKAEATALSTGAEIEASKQEIERRRLDLEYSKITAPISGRVSRAMLTAGNLVDAGGADPVLTTIRSVDPMYVYFNMDERAVLGLLTRRGAPSPEERKKPLRERQVPFTFALEIDEGFPHEGILNFADYRVDTQTGTVEMRGEVPNPDARLIPGSRVRVRLPISKPYQALLVPDTALLSDQDRRYLLVLGENNVVLRRNVTLGKLLDDGMRVIEAAGETGGKDGVTIEDWVVVLGLQRCRINYPVEPVDAAGKPITKAPHSSPAQPGHKD